MAVYGKSARALTFENVWCLSAAHERRGAAEALVLEKKAQAYEKYGDAATLQATFSNVLAIVTVCYRQSTQTLTLQNVLRCRPSSIGSPK